MPGARPPAGHILPDLLAPGLKVVFCGSAVGRKSAALGLPYAGPGNKFWPTLFNAGLVQEKLAPADFRRLLDHGHGLTDLNKTEFGADTDLSPAADDAAALRGKIARFRPRILAFTAKRPAQAFLGRRAAYGFQAETIGDTRIYVLPSPSGLAVRYWDEDWWRGLARAAARLST